MARPVRVIGAAARCRSATASRSRRIAGEAGADLADYRAPIEDAAG